MEATMVSMKDVTFRYGRKAPLFEGLSLELHTDGIYGLLGKNGAGKTTLLKLLCGLRFPEWGNVSVMGCAPEFRDPRLMEELFLIPEEFPSPQVKVGQYGWMYGSLYPRYSSHQFYSYITEFELDPDQKISDMSYGQKKKVLLAFGLAANTSLLLLDEPTNGLDIPSKGQFRRLLAGAANPDRTIMVSTHQVRDMENLIDPIVILEEGRVIFNHTVEEVTQRLAMGVTQDEPEGTLYSERALGGYAAVRERAGGAATRIDLELLFNAVTARPTEIARMFSKEAVR
jgi:ABC-2 type transport system ATP-binding protein